MSERHRLPWIVIGFGALFLLSPVAVSSLNFGEPTYEYEAVEFSHEDGQFDLPPPPEFSAPFYHDNIACLDETRQCALERYVNDAGGVPIEEVSFTRSPYDYVYLDGTFYRTEEVTENGTTSLTHEEEDANTALRRSSVAYDSAHPAYRDAVDEGVATANERIETPRIVTVDPGGPDERFYYVHATQSPSPGEHEPGLGDRVRTVGFAAVGFAIGLALVLRGQRMRLRTRRR